MTYRGVQTSAPLPPSSLRFPRETHKVVIAMRAVLVRLLKDGHVLAKGLLALLAQEGHLDRLGERVVLLLGVALCALVSPARRVSSG